MVGHRHRHLALHTAGHHTADRHDLNSIDGTDVSGIVSISVQATDNVSVELLDVSFWNQYLGQKVTLDSVANSDSLTVNWDTRGLTPATYAVWAFAQDAIGNWTRSEISVNVTASAKSMKVTSISLSGKVQSGKASIAGNVYVRDAFGQAVAGASVTAQCILPNGSTTTSTTQTDSAGRARFTVSGARGIVYLDVTHIAKADYFFDSAGSVLSKSITK